MKGSISRSIHFCLLLVFSRWQSVGGQFVIGYDCPSESATPCTTPDFCSEDGVCHLRDCESIYRYAEEKLRGNRPSEPQEEGELECYVNEFPPNNVVEPPCPPNQDGGGLFPIAVYHTCEHEYRGSTSGFACGNEVVYNAADQTTYTVVSQEMNRVCTAKPNPRQRFICYDIAPETGDLESYFAGYFEAVESIGGCDSVNNNNNDVTNSTASGHVVISVLIDEGGVGTGRIALGDGKFDPFQVAGSSVSFILMDDTPSTSSPHRTGLVSGIITAMMIISYPWW